MDALENSRLILDDYAAKILAATTHKPKSAIELSKKLAIPIAICYRRINKLEKSDLLEEADRVLTQEGKRVSVYRSKLKNAHIVFEDGKFKVKIEKRNEPPKRNEWESINLIER